MFTSPTTPTSRISSNTRQFLITPLHNRYDITSEIIKNIVHFAHFLRLCDESLSKYPIFKSNTTNWEIGTEFSLMVEDRIQIHFRLKTLVETDYYTHVEYFAYKTEPESFQYSFVMNAHYLTQGTCLLITNYMYPNTVNLPSTNQTKEAQRRRKLYRKMEYKIMRGFYQRFNVEYININCSMQFLWELILNLKSLQKFVHILGNKVDYEGKVISKGTIINILSQSHYSTKSNYIEQEVEVTALNQYEMECEIVFHTKRGSFKYSHEHIIKFFIYKGEGSNNCMFYMINLFDCEVEKAIIKEMRIKKRNILVRLKMMVESYITSLKKINPNEITYRSNSSNKQSYYNNNKTTNNNIKLNITKQKREISISVSPSTYSRSKEEKEKVMNNIFL